MATQNREEMRREIRVQSMT
uniref:Uncharacterized protein n=1 Tax=Arundo donax TaxID=35708 RepID=A0A0A9BE68_ARUDO